MIFIWKRKSINPYFFRTWFVAQAAVATILLTVLYLLAILEPFIEQVIVWPLTSFENPKIDISFIFSFVWFPISLVVMAFLVLFAMETQRVNARRHLRYLVVITVLAYFYFIYFFSVYSSPAGETNTLKSVPGLIKTASVNLQFMPSYAAATLAIFLLIQFCLRLFRSSQNSMDDRKILEYGLMLSLCITGWVQLYPLHDNVHLWFITPLLVIPAIFFLKESLPNFSTYLKPLVVVLSCFLSIQLLSLYSFLSIDRVPLNSKELNGMAASVDFRDTTDQTMILLNKHVTKRNLRNNCVASLFSVSDRSYRSIDGNFSANFFGLFVQNTPIVDPVKNLPELVFECDIDTNRKQQLLELGLEVVFEVKHVSRDTSKGFRFNALFRNTSS
jgi:hypothetical protein